MPERGQDYSYLDSANLLVHLEDEVSQLMKFLTLYYVEMDDSEESLVDAVLSLPGAGTEPTALLMKTCVCDPLAVRERGWRMGLQL